MVRITQDNSKSYIGRIIQYNSRGELKYAIIKKLSPTGKTLYIQPVEPNPISLFKEVNTNDLNNTLEIVSRKVYLKI
jgi:hypothetical protein|uniref:Uncharacterized protein n=1 Tax=viral metagenome TaxID=1070528 RepID=A0A6C0DVH0_9ZZZZ